MRTVLVAAVAVALVTSVAQADESKAPTSGEPRARCKNNIKHAVRGHALVAKLLCPDGSRPVREATSSRFLANGCLEDTFTLRCGSERFAVVVPADAPPLIPEGLRQIEGTDLAGFKEAQAVLEKDPARALKIMDEVLKREPNVDRFWRLRGLSELLLKKPKEALWDYDKVLQLSPSNFLYRLEHAEVTNQAGSPKKAIGELRKLDEEVDPEWPRRRELLSVLATLLAKVGDPEAPAARARACQAGARHLCSLAPEAGTGDKAEKEPSP